MNIKDFKWTEKRFGTRFANILKKLGGLSKDGTDGSIEYKDEQGNITKLVTDSNFSSLLAKNGLIEVKWQELKDKRDNGQLISGSLYRITDYNCTTTQEDTQSAGHQFDIVLLALSENKLAEEGWAMMHDNIYDVTFYDGITLKCYLYKYYDSDEERYYYNVVDINTLLGTYISTEDCDVDEQNKIATMNSTGEHTSDELVMENLPYNYFQNSNLSAWKVWYCLDNDTARFAWADDNLPSIVDEDTIYVRKPSSDTGDLFAWYNENDNIYDYTKTEHPSIGDETFDEEGETNAYVSSVFGFGRGVIYRLIDEWNNDVPYDFKNIKFLRKLDGGQIDAQGTDIYCYTFTLYDLGNAEYKDASIFAIEYVNDEGGINPCYNNSINSTSAYNSPIDYNNKYSYALPYITFLSSVESGSYSWGVFDNKLFGAYNSTFEGNCAINIVLGGGVDYTDLYESFVCGSQRASMESI